MLEQLIDRLFDRLLALLREFFGAGTGEFYEDGSPVLDVCESSVDAAYLLIRYAQLLMTGLHPDDAWRFLWGFMQGCQTLIT